MNLNTIRFQNAFNLLLIIGIAVNASGFFMTILEPDAAYYAGISKSMAFNNDFINLMDLSLDWLDKPHFPFWITALSFKIFGYSSFAYRLPAFLFWLSGIYYTWKFAKLFYSDIVAKLAILIYLSAFHLVLSNSDVRAEPFLTGMVIAAVYYFFKASEATKTLSIYLILGSLFAAMALMTKGLFVLVPIAAGFAFQWVIKKEWNKIFQLRWLLAFFLISIFIFPELYCLYLQFDLHPEKIVFGKTNVSGIRFFLWDSQFGRFFNTGPIKGKGDFFFYFHTLLWAFLPWCLLFFASCYDFCRKLLNKKEDIKEMISFGAGFFAFLMFSLSSFQLPHYLNIVFPFYAILTAQWLVTLHTKRSLKIVNVLQICIGFLMLFAGCGLLYLFGVKECFFAIIMVFIIVSLAIIFRNKLQPFGIMFSFLSSCLLFLMLNLIFYPALLKYQSGTNAAAYMNRNFATAEAAVFGIRSFSFEYEMKKPVQLIYFDELHYKASSKNLILFTNEENLKLLIEKKYKIEVLKNFTHFHVSQLNIKFLNHNTRNQATEKYFLVRFIS